MIGPWTSKPFAICSVTSNGPTATSSPPVQRHAAETRALIERLDAPALSRSIEAPWIPNLKLRVGEELLQLAMNSQHHRNAPYAYAVGRHLSDCGLHSTGERQAGRTDASAASHGAQSAQKSGQPLAPHRILFGLPPLLFAKT